MQRPEVNGWQVTTNENGVKMATLPRDTMESLLKYAEYAEKQLRLFSVSNTEEKLCDKCYDTDGFYLGTTCPKCDRPFRSVKA